MLNNRLKKQTPYMLFSIAFIVVLSDTSHVGISRFLSLGAGFWILLAFSIVADIMLLIGCLLIGQIVKQKNYEEKNGVK